MKLFVQAQDARLAGLDPRFGRNPRGFRNPLDFRQAYVAVGREDGPWTLQVGRKELSFTDNRLLGSRGWSNTSPTFDGSMLTLRRAESKLHLLAYTQVDVRDGFDVPSRTRFVYGMVGSARLPGKEHFVTPFFLTSRREVDMASHLGGLLRTAGIHLAGTPWENWDYQLLLAAQLGGRPELPQRAGAWVWELGRTFPDAPARPRIGFEWSYASGDRDPADGKNGTFDTLFPSPHGIYGEQDIVAFRNLKYLQAGVDLHPVRKLAFSLDLIDLRLASGRDGLYQLNNRLRAGPGDEGAANGSIGTELDLVVLYRPVQRIELRLGVSRFFAGPFVREYVPGGESQTFLNMGMTIRY